MPTTREVEAARVERMRRAAEARDQQQRPRTALDRRLARIAEAHAAATAPASWRCRVEGCPIVDRWHPAESRDAALEAADTHYNRNHYTPPPTVR